MSNPWPTSASERIVDSVQAPRKSEKCHKGASTLRGASSEYIRAMNSRWRLSDISEFFLRPLRPFRLDAANISIPYPE
jgi:hypothetical protein